VYLSPLPRLLLLLPLVVGVFPYQLQRSLPLLPLLLLLLQAAGVPAPATMTPGKWNATCKTCTTFYGIQNANHDSLGISMSNLLFFLASRPVHALRL
jgi:hypothetical protein